MRASGSNVESEGKVDEEVDLVFNGVACGGSRTKGTWTEDKHEQTYMCPANKVLSTTHHVTAITGVRRFATAVTPVTHRRHAFALQTAAVSICEARAARRGCCNVRSRVAYETVARKYLLTVQ